MQSGRVRKELSCPSVFPGRGFPGLLLNQMHRVSGDFILQINGRHLSVLEAGFALIDELKAALLQVHSSLEEAARTCGASHTESLKDITLPLIRPAMVAGFFLIFLPAMREVTTSILLYGPYTRTLGVQIYAMQDAGSMSEAAALGSVAIVLIFICDTIVKYITKDRKGV